MKKLQLLFLLFITTFGHSQHQESEPTFYTEILERVAFEDFYNVKFGDPLKVVAFDTTYTKYSEPSFKKTIYSFKNRKDLIVKKYKNDELVGDEILELDSINRILNYKGNLKYEGEKWYETNVKYKYTSRLKIKEKINDSGETYLRYIVEYDSLKMPLKIEHIIVDSESSKLQAIDYDYPNRKFILMDFNYNGQLVNELKGNFNSDFIIEKNEQGDVTKMYWVLGDMNEPYIHHMEYTYDEKGNWIRIIKNILGPDGTVEPFHRTYRKIEYKN